jgi:hypothetical protein
MEVWNQEILWEGSQGTAKKNFGSLEFFLLKKIYFDYFL